MSFRMNSPQGKAILALVRDGDYAHPGGEEAIELVVNDLPKTSTHRVLDVGCGRGGTANWFHEHGWGEVVGIDIDANSIDYAQKAYPHVQFHACDIVDLGQVTLSSFDLAYLFNSFYAFPDQQGALRAIRGGCRDSARLAIFDYSQPKGKHLPAALGTEIGNPIITDTLVDWMEAEEWCDISVTDITDKFLHWYDVLLIKVEKNRQPILAMGGQDWYDYVLFWYTALRDALASGRVGGTLIHATALAQTNLRAG